MLGWGVKEPLDPSGAGEPRERKERWGTRSGLDVVTLMVGLNVLVFGYMNSLPSQTALIELIQAGALSLDGLKEGAWWQLGSHLFLHGGDLGALMRALHLSVNMFVVYQVGKELLADVGPWHWVAIYFGSGMLGGVFQILVTPESPLLGASGAAFGLVTAFCAMHAFEELEAWVMGFRFKISGGVFARAVVISSAVLGVLALASPLMLPLVSQMGHFAHLGGALGGLLYVKCFGFGPRSLTKLDLQQQRVLNDARLEDQRSSPEA